MSVLKVLQVLQENPEELEWLYAKLSARLADLEVRLNDLEEKLEEVKREIERCKKARSRRARGPSALL